MVACTRRGPILEIPGRGKYIYERLTPGTIREEDYYEEFRIVPGGRPGTRLLVACPRGQSRRGKCRTGQRVLRIWHHKDGLKKLLKECKEGRLTEKRAAQMKRLDKDIEALKRGSPSFGSVGRTPLFSGQAATPLGRLGQFVLTAAVGTMISIIVIKLVFPGVFGGGDTAAAAAKKPGEDFAGYRGRLG